MSKFAWGVLVGGAVVGLIGFVGKKLFEKDDKKKARNRNDNNQCQETVEQTNETIFEDDLCCPISTGTVCYMKK